MNDLVTRPRYELTDAEVFASFECADRMLAYNEQRGWKDRAYKAGSDRRSNFALGNYGEIAVARWAGVSWTCNVGAYAKHDVVAGKLLLHVRATRWARDPLLAIYSRTADPDDGIFVLAVLDVPYVELAGWTTGRQARLVGEQWDFGGGMTTWVRVDRLWPMGSLKL